MQIGVFVSGTESPRVRSIPGQPSADPHNRPNRPIVRCAYLTLGCPQTSKSSNCPHADSPVEVAQFPPDNDCQIS